MEEESDDAPTRPVKKAKKETSQSSMADFLTKKPGQAAKKATGSRTVSGSKPKAKPPTKKVVDSDEEEDKEDSDVPPPPPRRPTARATATVKKYVEIPSDDEGVEDDSMYLDD